MFLVCSCYYQLRGVMRQYEWPNMDTTSQSGSQAIVDAWWATSPWVTASEDADAQAHYYLSVSGCTVKPGIEAAPLA